MSSTWECSRREIVLVLLVFLAYMAPSKVFQEHVMSSYSSSKAKAIHDYDENDDDGGLNDLDVNDVVEHREEDETGFWKPPLPEKTSFGLYQNEHELVHVIHTRFMQFQPDLTTLGKARLDLFQTFTLPSILRQTSQQFLWIVWMDPQLETNLRHDFIKLIQNVPNCVVIGSRAKMPMIRSDFLAELMESSLYAGHYDLLMDYYEASQTRVVLHTELDADDAIYYDFVRGLQRRARETLATSTLKYDYRYFCVAKRLEWNYYHPTNTDQQEQNNTTNKIGYLVGKESRKECPPGGYTKGFGPATDSNDLPRVGRYDIHLKTPQCDFTSHKCIDRIYGGASEYSVLRSRTPTAHGMTDVVPPKPNSKKQLTMTDSWANKQEELWKGLPKNFGVNVTSVQELRKRFEEDMVDILLQNLEGQCKDGFSCKGSSKDHLKELKNKYQNQQGGGGGDN